MNTPRYSLPLVSTSPNNQLLNIIFVEGSTPILPEESTFRENSVYLQLDTKHYPSSPHPLTDSQGYSLDHFANYGVAAGLYWIWKNVNYPYISFSMTTRILNISDKDLQSFMQSSSDIYLLAPRGCGCPLQENYRSRYYSYDFRMMLSVLKRQAPLYYNYAKEHVVESYQFIEPTCIIKKEVFRKFCAWLFPILAQCHKHLVDKCSTYQNRYLEHLTYYLFIIYVKYNEKKMKCCYTNSFADYQIPSTDSYVAPSSPVAGDIHSIVQNLINNGDLEEAYSYLKEKESCEERDSLLSLFDQYEKERRYFKTTLFETSHDLKQLSALKNALPTKQHTRKILIFEWASVSHKESIVAFESLGFECHTYKTPYKSWIYDEDFLDQINRHLDLHSFDMVFSLNYFAMVAEACYVHNTPYVAWCYDSPTFIGDLRYLRYPTNHVFMFDSHEAHEYNQLGFDNVYYMPLAVNVDRYDNITCTSEEQQKYQASISFVGSLYSTELTVGLNYLTDYQKGYINALVDNRFGNYDYNPYQFIVSNQLMDWLSQPDFNKIINKEWDKEKATDKTPTPSRLSFLLNRMVTNRERLLLISMLSNHWDFKLYSQSQHEVFKSTIQCGIVDYYTQMPKVFKNSRINLNSTLRCIQAGIPLRCLDIMGCHGLLLTNYQKDFDEHFKDHENILIYHSIEEAYDKAAFYLSHETERQRIENNGYDTVRKYYNYPDVLKQILTISKLDYLLK